MSAFYVYCVVQRAQPPSVVRVPAGVPEAGAPLVRKLGTRLWIVIADVPLRHYGGDALEASLRDLEWVSRVALAHESVVEHFVKQRGAAVIPMKLFTMFSSAERAVTEMKARRAELTRVFERITGCEEWGVRVVAHDPPRRSREPDRIRSGAAFLAARKQARDDSKQARVEAASAADAAFSSLSEIARDRRRRTEVPAGGVPPLLDAAFLVPSRRRARFHATVEKLAADVARSGGRMTLSGPWPPYNFVAGEDAG
jgi:hypothetical protein